MTGTEPHYTSPPIGAAVPLRILEDEELMALEQRSASNADAVLELTAQVRQLKAIVRGLQAIAPRDTPAGRVCLSRSLRDWRISEAIVDEKDLPPYARSAYSIRVTQVWDRVKVEVYLAEGSDADSNAGAAAARPEEGEAATGLFALFEIGSGVPCVHVSPYGGGYPGPRQSVFALPGGSLVSRVGEAEIEGVSADYVPGDAPAVIRRVLTDEGFVAQDGAAAPMGEGAAVLRQVERFFKCLPMPGTDAEAHLAFEVGPHAVVLTGTVAGSASPVARRDIGLSSASRGAGQALSELLLVVPGVISEVRDSVQRLDTTARL